MLCLVSAAFYACYTIVLRKALPDDDEANVALFFGYVGLLCSIVFAPVVALLGGIGALHLKAIPSKAYLIILVQGEAAAAAAADVGMLVLLCQQHKASLSI
jgi:drug/metabolite transporter (DMT)-like permease